MQCTVNANGDAVYHMNPSYFDLFMDVVNPRIVGGQIIRRVTDFEQFNNEKLKQLFETHNLTDIVTSRITVLHNFNSLCEFYQKRYGEHAYMESHLMFKTHDINTGFRENENDLIEPMEHTLNMRTHDFNLCNDYP